MFSLNLLLRRGRNGLAVALFWSAAAFALPVFADRDITGSVTDENGDRLPGVNVLVKGTQRGTLTSNDGAFTINVPDNATLVFSFVGFVTQEVSVGNRTNVEVVLAPDNKSLEELVVIGYGTARKSDLTGAVGSVKEDQLRERPAPSLNQSLQGRVTGVQVNVNSGRPGGRSNVRIRGFSSINSSNNPLYVVDGVMLPQGNQNQASQAIDYINPNDIVSVEVLKDASSTAIYGARGANGVILITTKKGKSGEGTVTYGLDLSVPTGGPKRPKVLNAQEYLDVEDLAYANIQKYDPDGWSQGKWPHLDPQVRRAQLLERHPDVFSVVTGPDGKLIYKPNYDTDWFKEATQNRVSQNHQLGFSGGNTKTTYSLSLNYRDDQGLLKTSYLKRYATRLTIDDQVKKWLRIGGTLSYNYQAENLVDVSDAVPRQIVEDFPFLPVRWPDGTFADNRDYPQAEGSRSSVHRLMGRRYIQNTQTTLGSLYANVNLAPGLVFRSVLGINIMQQDINYSQTRTLTNEVGEASKNARKEIFWSLENYLTYDKVISDIHAFNAMAGISWQETQFESTGASIRQFATDYFGFNNLGAGAVSPAVGSGASRFAFNSYFGRVNYTLNNKYLFTFTGRLDGSSKFGENHKYAFFPSAAAAWKISDEDFMSSVPTISNLKLRSSFGMTGNSEIPAYSSLSLLSSTYATIYGDTRVVGTGINRLANPNLRWEKTAQTDVGLEFGLFKGRIAVEADYYYRKTTDMLLDAPVPRTSGYAVIRRNVGSMENKGFEFAINTVNIERSNFTWNTNFNISFNRNKILSLATPADIFGVGAPGITNETGIIRVGEPAGAFWGLVRLGTWGANEAEQAAKFRSYRGGGTMLPGDVKYLDVNGDNAITDADRQIIGNGTPKGWGTLANTVRVGNFDLTLDLQFSYGNDVMDMNLHASEDRVSIANSYASVLDAWTPTNQNTPIAEIRETRAGYVTNVDTRWVFDGSFLRGRNLLLGYNIPSNAVSKIKLSSARLYLSVQNFFLLTPYPFGDPEMTPMRGGDGNNVFSQGMMWHAYPKPTTYMAGIQISL